MQAPFFLQSFNQIDFLIAVKNHSYVNFPSKKSLLKGSTLRNGRTQEKNCLYTSSVIILGAEVQGIT